MSTQPRPSRARFNPWRVLRLTVTWVLPVIAYLAVITWAFMAIGHSLAAGLIFAVSIGLGIAGVAGVLNVFVVRTMDLMEVLGAREQAHEQARAASMARHPSGSQRSSAGGPSERGVNPDSWA